MTGRDAVAALNREWLELATGSTEILSGWASAEPVLGGAGDLIDVLHLIRVHPDATLAALLRLGGSGDPRAFRVVLQAMLGMAVRACSGRPSQLPEAVSELWVAIAEYPVDRRPRAIAANLAWTVRRQLRPSTGALPVAVLDRPAPPPQDDPDAAHTLAEARRLGLIDDLTHRTLSCVYVSGRSSAQAADELGTTPELIRWRCSRALRRLSGHADLLSA